MTEENEIWICPHCGEVNRWFKLLCEACRKERYEGTVTDEED